MGAALSPSESMWLELLYDLPKCGKVYAYTCVKAHALTQVFGPNVFSEEILKDCPRRFSKNPLGPSRENYTRRIFFVGLCPARG
jgi:hypothetical protein